MLHNSRLFDETKAQHETEKVKLNDEINALKGMNQKNEVESQNFKLRILEQKSVIDSQKEKLG